MGGGRERAEKSLVFCEAADPPDHSALRRPVFWNPSDELQESVGPRESNSLGNLNWCSQTSVLGKWDRTQMGSDGCNQVLTGFYLSGPVRVRLVPLKTHDFKGC